MEQKSSTWSSGRVTSLELPCRTSSSALPLESEAIISEPETHQREPAALLYPSGGRYSLRHRRGGIRWSHRYTAADGARAVCSLTVPVTLFVVVKSASSGKPRTSGLTIKQQKWLPVLWWGYSSHLRTSHQSTRRRVNPNYSWSQRDLAVFGRTCLTKME